jgi:cell division topological specificity factor
MNVLDLLRQRGSAPVARERLQILLSYERAGRDKRDLLVVLHEEITAAIAKHVTVDRDNVHVRMDRSDTTSTLGIEVEIPHSVVRAGGLAFREDPS